MSCMKCNIAQGEDAVRVGVYQIINRKSDDKYDSEFRGLCERHEVTGIDELTVNVTKLSEVLK